MQTFQQNITSIYGAQGQTWLKQLPCIIEKLSLQWQLSHIQPVSNLTFNYVAKALRNNNEPVILKVGYENKIIKDEKLSLDYFAGASAGAGAGAGAIKVLEYNPKYNALLLQQAKPGITLKRLYPKQIKVVAKHYVDTMKKLHNKMLPIPHYFRHISDWLFVLETIKTDAIPQNLLAKAITLKNKLLSTIQLPVLLHGDLHHDNILQHHNTWLAIDPKGIIGEAEFEIAAFNFINDSDICNNKNIKLLFDERLQYIAQTAELDKQRIYDWVLVRLVLMAAWMVEDKMDCTNVIKLTDKLFL